MPPRKRTRKLKPGETPPTPEILISTNIRPSACSRCGKPINTGYVSGGRVYLDRMWLSLKGELLALVSGLKTYQTQLGGRGKVFVRRPYHIERGAPEWGKILAQHRCEHRWSADSFEIPKAKEPDSDVIPF